MSESYTLGWWWVYWEGAQTVHVGAFRFSFEPGTASEPLGDPIPSEVKEERFKRLMEKQQPISFERNQALVGRSLDVLIEGAYDLSGEVGPV